MRTYAAIMHIHKEYALTSAGRQNVEVPIQLNLEPGRLNFGLVETPVDPV